jgi:hypothetical protein
VSMPTPPKAEKTGEHTSNAAGANGRTGCGQGPARRHERLACMLLLTTGASGA